MGRYLEAKRYLSRILDTPGTDQEPATEVQRIRDDLEASNRLLQLYPSPRLNPKERAARILSDRKLALARLAECAKDKKSPAAETATPKSSPSTGLSNPLASFASRFTRRPANPTGSQPANPAPADPLTAVQERWLALPPKITAADLEKDPDLEQAQIQLIYDTEIATQQVCGAPSGDDALLLKIAQAPNQVEEE
jgi:hypothetical protein